MSLNIIALFCEDIREEKSNAETFVGVLPSNLSVPAFPSGLPKLGIHCRFLFPVDFPDFEAEVFLRASWGQRVEMGTVGRELVAQAKRETLAINLPVASVIIKVLIVPMPLPGPGRIEIVVKRDDTESVCGAIAIRSASTPPVS